MLDVAKFCACAAEKIHAEPFWCFAFHSESKRNTRNPENLCTFLFLHSTIFFYPVAIFGNLGIDARFVLASAAFAPARHTSQEDPPLGAGERQGSTRVTLRIREERDYFQLEGFLWVPISIKKGHINRSPITDMIPFFGTFGKTLCGLMRHKLNFLGGVCPKTSGVKVTAFQKRNIIPVLLGFAGQWSKINQQVHLWMS